LPAAGSKVHVPCSCPPDGLIVIAKLLALYHCREGDDSVVVDGGLVDVRYGVGAGLCLRYVQKTEGVLMLVPK
jgi:hypothetical protein